MTDTNGRFYAEEETRPTVPRHLGHFYLVVRHIGFQAVAAAVNYDYGRLPLDYANGNLGGVRITGLTVPEPRENWQRARRFDSTVDTSSGFQIHCYDVGSFINTWSFAYQDVVGGGHHSVYAYDFDDPLPRVFDDNPATDLVLQVSLEVPWVALWTTPSSVPLRWGKQVSSRIFENGRPASPLRPLCCSSIRDLARMERIRPMSGTTGRRPS